MNTESKSGFFNAYFYRSHILWNRLPLSIRQISSVKKFRYDLKKFIWNSEIAPLYKSLINDKNNNYDFVAYLSSSDLD